jgi:hypothetical protein
MRGPPGEDVDPLTSTRHSELLRKKDASGKEEWEDDKFEEAYVDPGPDQTLLRGDRHVEPTTTSTDAKVDALTDCVMAIT